MLGFHIIKKLREKKQGVIPFLLRIDRISYLIEKVLQYFKNAEQEMRQLCCLIGGVHYQQLDIILKEAKTL